VIEEYLGSEKTKYIFNSGKEITLSKDEYEELLFENETYKNLELDLKREQIETNNVKDQFNTAIQETRELKDDVNKLKEEKEELEEKLENLKDKFREKINNSIEDL
jgi:predicted transcriptional regulator